MSRFTLHPVRIILLLASSLSPAPVNAGVPFDAAAEPDPDVAKSAVIARADTMIMVPMRDGTGLATDVYLPKDREGPFPTIFVKTPYDFNRIENTRLEWGIAAVERGYAYVVQNESANSNPTSWKRRSNSN